MDDAYLGHERSGNALVKTGTALCLGQISRSDLLSSSFVDFFHKELVSGLRSSGYGQQAWTKIILWAWILW